MSSALADPVLDDPARTFSQPNVNPARTRTSPPSQAAGPATGGCFGRRTPVDAEPPSSGIPLSVGPMQPLSYVAQPNLMPDRPARDRHFCVPRSGTLSADRPGPAGLLGGGWPEQVPAVPERI